MTEPKRTSVWFLLALAVFIIIVVFNVSYASGDCKGHSCNDGGDVIVGGDDINVGVTTGPVSTDVGVTTGAVSVDSPVTVNTGGNKALALSNNMGDVDIAGCLGSTQWATPLFSKQKLVVNWPCLAEFYLRQGMWTNAAMAICNTEVRKEFDTEQECRDAHPFEAMAVIEAPVIIYDEDEDERIDYLEMQVAELAQGYEKEPKVIQRTIIEQQPFLNAEKRAKLQAILDE